MSPSTVQIDLEVTNRCNANCSFCPREYTPHQGLMAPETFDRALGRAIEFRDLVRGRLDPAFDAQVALCGLGEPLLHPHTPSFVAKVRSQGLFCSISSNGALLTEEKGRALLDAGLSRIDLNVGEMGDQYDEVYELSWEKTRDRILRFREMAGGACELRIIIVLHRGGPDHGMKVASFWHEQGITQSFTFDPAHLSNRGGTLSFDHIRFDHPADRQGALEALRRTSSTTLCGFPFLGLFIGYDGQYYLCCSDWTKETPLGSVHDRSFLDVMGAKLDYVVHRKTVCARCNYDPFNRMASTLGQIRRGELPESAREPILGWLSSNDSMSREILSSLGIPIPSHPGAHVYDVEPTPVRLPMAKPERARPSPND